MNVWDFPIYHTKAMEKFLMDIISRIHALGRFSGEPGLHRIRALMCALGDPQKNLRFIHLAGTNGKGSTATMIASIMQEAGYRVGLYTSPYLVDFNERIQINNVMISDAQLNQFAEKTFSVLKTLELPKGEHIGEFEFVTAMAFQYFNEQNCDLVVLEAGLGGAFDATNVIDEPDVAVITSVSLDHVDVLGNTLEEIAQTKAGIIKPGSLAVTTLNQDPSVMSILQKACPAISIPEQPVILKADLTGNIFLWRNQKYHISLIGRHQIENGCIALQVIQVMKSLGWVVFQEAILHGLFRAKLPARMEILSEKPRIILDGGHNDGGVKVIKSTLKDCKGLRLILGMVADKNIEGCVSSLAPLAIHVYVTAPQNERALAAEKLAHIVCSYQPSVSVHAHFSEAIRAAYQESNSDDTILICGSLYLAGEAKDFFTKRQNMST